MMQNEQDNHPLYAAINRKLAALLAATPLPPAWSEAWVRLGPHSSEEERLAVYRAIRDSGVLPAEAGSFLVAWQADALVLRDAGEALREHAERLQAIRHRYGVGEDEPWPEGQEPPEYARALEQIHDAWDALYAARLDELGEAALARLFREDRAAFGRQAEAGRAYFHDAHDEEQDGEDWLEGLLDAVAECVEADSPLGPLGLRYAEEDGCWEVTIYPTPVELVGGAHDGEVVAPGFTLDLEQLRAAFDSIVALGWNALGLNDPEGPHVHVEGVYQGRELFLQVLAQAPDDEEPGLKMDATPKRRKRNENGPG
jgi:hypothetical protein